VLSGFSQNIRCQFREGNLRKDAAELLKKSRENPLQLQE
jgi:hypothetical protein